MDLTVSSFNSVSIEPPPLIFCRGIYRNLSSAERNPEWPLPMHCSTFR
jgi:flavin reductase (DIM6/NTAB) family NADH-FMN oxidoreductase RutF